VTPTMEKLKQMLKEREEKVGEIYDVGPVKY
jgi:hypothetical protein